MATTYYPDAASSDLNKNTVTAPANSQKLLQTAAGSATGVVITLPSSGSNLIAAFIADANDPSTTGGAALTSYSATFNVTTSNMNLNLNSIRVARLNSAGTQQATISLGTVTTSELQTNGVVTRTDVTNNLGTFAAGDRLSLQFTISNTAMSVQSVTLEVGLASGNEEVVAPWTFAGAPAIPDIIMAPSR